MPKHSKRKDEDTKIIDLGEYREAEASIEYEDREDEAEEEELLEKRRIPKAVYRSAIILLVLVLVLAVWLNREALQPDRLVSWVKLQLMGSGEGDGFPVSITGSQVSAANFTSVGGDVLVLSDTAFTRLDSSGKELLSLRHSFNKPAMRTSGSRTLLYNDGSTGYLLLSGTRTAVDGVADKEIISGAVAQNGRFALGLRGTEGASELQVFQADGSVQFTYSFAQDYITAIALNYDGSYGMVCTVRAEKGELISRVTVFYFNSPEPLAQYETGDNLLLDAFWTEGGELFALGETALLRARSSDYDFTEYSYEGRKPTAYCLSQNRVFLSLSAYEHAGPCTLLIFRGREEPVTVESSERIVSLSVSGGTVGALVNGSAVFYDHSSGTELGRASVNADAKSIALMNERSAYALGVSEIRTVEIE